MFVLNSSGTAKSSFCFVTIELGYNNWTSQAGEEEIQFRRHVSAFNKNKTNKILALFRIRFGDNAR